MKRPYPILSFLVVDLFTALLLLRSLLSLQCASYLSCFGERLFRLLLFVCKSCVDVSYSCRLCLVFGRGVIFYCWSNLLEYNGLLGIVVALLLADRMCVALAVNCSTFVYGDFSCVVFVMAWCVTCLCGGLRCFKSPMLRNILADLLRN